MAGISPSPESGARRFYVGGGGRGKGGEIWGSRWRGGHRQATARAIHGRNKLHTEQRKVAKGFCTLHIILNNTWRECILDQSS